eukprot:948810_1
MGAKLGCASPNFDSTIQTEQDMDCNEYYSARSKDQIKEWLNDLALCQYISNFIDNGFDRMDIIKTNLRNNKTMLKTIGIDKIGHQMVIIASIEKLYKEEENETLISTSIDHIVYSKYDDEPLLTNTNEKKNT